MKKHQKEDYPLEYEDDFVPAFYVAEVLVILVLALAILVLLDIAIVEVLTGTL